MFVKFFVITFALSNNNNQNIMELDKSKLENGLTLLFTSENGERDAEVFKTTKQHEFVIWFNGQLIHSSKTFKSLERRFNILKQDWGLTFVGEENNN